MEKKRKNYYMPITKTEIVNMEKLKFIQIKGSGNPNSEEFSEKVGTLYSLAYAIKMMPKKWITPIGYFDYTVYPLEGIWDLKEESRNDEVFDKNNLVYTIMIRQPEFVNEGVCVQMMHIGPFDDEYKTFEVMKKFCEDNNLLIKNKAHR